ncbi:oligosaccharide flippase family protein [Photobacterium sanguinicancri]|uniref:oligosaccharide flippase family protein n=1 Tax=Photobacterium sanguinicancri TaxID=875932 RepID=UPI00248136A7|nr:oligosaccharide flippase family protein [Photobacterium sanguinicancri]
MIKKISFNFVSLIAKSLLSLFLFKIITESTSPSGYAPYGASLVFIGLMTTIGSIGLGPALVRAETINRNKINTFICSSLLLGLVLSVLLYISSALIENILDIPNSKLYLQLVSPIIVIKLVSMIYEAMSQRDLKIIEITKIDFMVFLFFHFLCQVIVLKLNLDLIWLVVCIILEEGVRLFCYKKLVGVSFSFTLDFNEMKKDIAFSSVLTINRIINYFNSQLDKIYVSNQLNPMDFAGYSRIFQLINYPVNIIGQLFDKVLYPIICKQVRSSTKRLNITSFIIVFLLGLIGTIFCYMLGDLVEEYFLNGTWGEYMNLYYILIILIPIRLVDRYSSICLNAIGKPLVRTVSQVLFIASLIIGLSISKGDLEIIASISIISYGVSALSSTLYLVFKNEK